MTWLGKGRYMQCNRQAPQGDAAGKIHRIDDDDLADM